MIIVKDGKAEATIVIGSNPSDAEKSAAQELQAYIWKMTSCNGQEAEKLPIKTEAEAPEGTRIFVGRSNCIEEMGISFDDLGVQGFKIQAVDNGLVLCGKDDLGTEYAVYTFLERYCGVRWFWPGETGEHIPHQRTIEIGDIRDIEEPDFKLRMLGGKSSPDLVWKKRNKVKDSGQYGAGHSWGKMAPPNKYGQKHPEYFALVNGTRERDWDGYDGQHGYQLCTTNPDVVKICVEYARKFFDEHPPIDFCGVGANDGAGWCECERCQALDTGKVVNGRRVITDRIYTFTNQIAAELKKTHPDKYVVQFAYSDYIEPPETVKPLDNVVVQITLNCECNYAPKHKEDQWRLLREWSELTPNIFMYEYFNHTWKLQLPRAIPKAIGEAIPFYRKCGSSFFYAQAMNDFGGEGLDLYIAAKLLWDTSLNVDDIVDDYCEKAFGNAASIVKKYFNRLEELWGATVPPQSPGPPGNPDHYLTMLTSEAVEELKGYLTEALKVAQAGEFEERIRFLMKGWRFYELELKAFRLLRKLSDKGIINYKKGSPSWGGKVAALSTLDIPQEEAKRLISETISAWEERDRYVEELKDSYVIDYHHIKAWNCIDYRFHPVARLKKTLDTNGR